MIFLRPEIKQDFNPPVIGGHHITVNMRQHFSDTNLDLKGRKNFQQFFFKKLASMKNLLVFVKISKFQLK